MKNRFVFASALLIAACSSKLNTSASKPVSTAVPPDSCQSFAPEEKRPADYGFTRPKARPEFAPVYVPEAAPRPLAVAAFAPARLLSTGAANRAEIKEQLKAVDSLVMQLQSMNSKDSTVEPGAAARSQVRTAARLNRPRPRPLLHRHVPNNMPRKDTLYVDTLGVKLALWIGPDGVQMNVLKGVVKKDDLPVQGTAVEIKPGFDWQHDGWLVAIGALIGLLLIIFTYNKTKCKDNAGIPENV